MLLSNFTMATTATGGWAIMKPLYWLFGKCMEGLLFVFNDEYFLALIVFTILTRLILFPLNVKQQRTAAKTTRIQPKIQKIQKKYNVNSISDPKQRQKANAKMQEEMQALYSREGHNPMNMGCGPMAFQMIFLMGIIGIIYYPLQYIIGISGISSQLSDISTALSISEKTRYVEFEILQNFANYKDILANQFGDIFTAEKISAIEQYIDHLRIGSLNMARVPKFEADPIIIIPILCLLTSLASTLVSTQIQKKNNPAMAQQQNQMMLMMLMMPIFSCVISFQVPAAVGFYWIISNLVALVQQLVMAKFFPPRKNIARSMIEGTIERRSREESIKKIKSEDI